MTSVNRALRLYLTQPPLDSDDTMQGGGRRGATFAEQLESARRRSRAGFWICVAMVILLFLVVLRRTYEEFGQLSRLPSGTVTSVFGVSATGAVLMMARFSREVSRAEFLLVLLVELRERDPDGFVSLLRRLCNKWYGLK